MSYHTIIQFDPSTKEAIDRPLVPQGAVLCIWQDFGVDRRGNDLFDIQTITGPLSSAEALEHVTGCDNVTDAFVTFIDKRLPDYREHRDQIIADLSRAWIEANPTPESTDDYPAWVRRVEGKAFCQSTVDYHGTSAFDDARHARSISVPS